MERLLYPGHSPKKIPTAMIYTMNMTEEQKKEYMAPVLGIHSMYLEGCFGEKPEEVFAYNTFQYNDREIYTDHFRRNVPAKWENRHKQFPIELQNAHEAGCVLLHGLVFRLSRLLWLISGFGNSSRVNGDF